MPLPVGVAERREERLGKQPSVRLGTSDRDLSPLAAALLGYWQSSRPAITAPGPLETDHDFMGFPPALYQLRYPAEATEALVAAVEACLPVSPERVARGLDHGAWMPLLMAWPDAEVPVVQLALDRRASPAQLYHIGQALQDLRAQGILVIGSGGTVHNLGALLPEGSPTPGWAREFDDWLAQVLEAGDMDRLMDFRRAAPHSAMAHPTDEHFRPIFLAAGAGDADAHTLHATFSYGSIGMRMIAFGEGERTG